MNTQNPTASTYRSIFLEKTWAHNAYFGWDKIVENSDIKILAKKQSILTSYLVLLNSNDSEVLNHQIKELDKKSGLSRIIIHDFKHVFEKEFHIGKRKFRKAEQSQRLLNIATIVIDLKKSEDELFKAMSSDYRRKIKKAEKKGITIDAQAKPEEATLKLFVDEFSKFAAERKLNSVDSDQLSKMYQNGDAVLFIAENNGVISNFLHVYLAGESGIFMYGVNLTKANDGAGQYLHWKAMTWLKQNNYEWYDLGGVVSTDASDGIYNFKAKFGGQFIDLGCEWYNVSRIVTYALAILRSVRKITHTIHSKI